MEDINLGVEVLAEKPQLGVRFLENEVEQVNALDGDGLVTEF
jgi:hypothetical protein